MNIVLLGPPASGKGTQANFLQSQYGFKSVCAGDLLREEVAKATTLGQEIKSIQDQGNLVDDHLISMIIGQHYATMDPGDDVLFDGYPRSVGQALDLELILISAGKKVDVVLYFDIDIDVLVKRVCGRYTCRQCGEIYHDQTKPTKKVGICDGCHGQDFVVRSDDNPAILSKRVENFYKTTQSVVGFYEEKGILHHVDGAHSYKVVSEQIKQLVEKFISLK